MEFSALVAQALEMSAVWHAGQWRRDPDHKVPFIVHPFSVALILSRAGYPDEVVAAGLLHDVVEDVGIQLKEISRLFGRRVAALVGEVTEPNVKDWKERKLKFMADLNYASPQALAIKSADHIDNLHSILHITKNGDDPWSLFYGGQKEKLWYETAMCKLLKGRVDPRLHKLHVAALAAVRKCARVAA